MGMVIKRFDVFLISLNPTVGHEIQKTRPCLIISPNEMNDYIKTVIVAPMSSKGRNYPTRIPCTFQGRKGQIILDQIRTVDKTRMVKKLGIISIPVQKKVFIILQEMFTK